MSPSGSASQNPGSGGSRALPCTAVPRHRAGHILVAVLLGLAIRSSTAADFATEMLGATFKLFHPDSTATCVLVQRAAPDSALYLVTAGHALERIKGDTAIVVLRQAKEDGSYERCDFTVIIRRADQPLWVRHATQDAAVLRLSELPPVAVAALPAALLAAERGLDLAGVHLCSSLFILTFPQRFEANSAGFPIARAGILASPLLPVRTHPTFLVDFTTFAGDSGGPVFIEGAAGHPLLAGIVIAQSHHEEKVTTEYQDWTLRHPLGLGTVLHAQFVLETLEQAATAAAPPPPDPALP